MKKVIKTLSKLIILSFLIICGCEKDSEETERNGIRPLTKLSTENIPALKDSIQLKYGETPWSIVPFRDNYVAIYEFRWETDDYIYIDEYISENKEFAYKYLLEMHQYYTNPFIEELKDQPAAVGDLSYSKGREFIRDNIIIKIHANGEFEEKLTEIAKQVDKEILKSITFTSIDQVKPVILNFTITNNPVTERTKTLLILDVEDPNNKKIYCHWKKKKIIGLGGSIIEDNHGNFYYYANSVYEDLETNEEELSVIVVNEFGFCTESDSAIYIITIKEESSILPCP